MGCEPAWMSTFSVKDGVGEPGSGSTVPARSCSLVSGQGQWEWEWNKRMEMRYIAEVDLMTNWMSLNHSPLSLHYSKEFYLPLLARAHRQPFSPFFLIILDTCLWMFLLESWSFLCNVGLRKDAANKLCHSSCTSSSLDHTPIMQLGQWLSSMLQEK